MRDERFTDWTPERFIPERGHRWLTWTALVCGLLLAFTLVSNVVLHAIMPRPYMDPEPPWFAMEPTTNQAPGKWTVELLGKTYTKETWPTFWWDLL